MVTTHGHHILIYHLVIPATIQLFSHLLEVIQALVAQQGITQDTLHTPIRQLNILTRIPTIQA